MNITRAEIKYVKTDSIIPYVNNPRHNENAVDKVAGSIDEFGFKQPIVVDASNVIIVGHTRYLAAKKLGLEEVPVIVASDLSDAKVKAYRIADNKVAEFSSWDEDLLRLELMELQDLDINMDTTGFGLDEILDLTEDIPEVEDEEEETEDEYVIQYNIVFNNEDEQELWFSFLRLLKAKYPDLGTISQRICEFIRGLDDNG